MMLRERYNTEVSLRAATQRRNVSAWAFAQPHNTKPEFTGMLIITIPAGAPVADKRDQHY